MIIALTGIDEGKDKVILDRYVFRSGIMVVNDSDVPAIMGILKYYGVKIVSETNKPNDSEPVIDKTSLKSTVTKSKKAS